MRYYSVAIVLGISVVVFGAASLILRNCFSDPNSNIKVIEHVAQEALNPEVLMAETHDPAPLDSIDKEVASMDILTKTDVLCNEPIVVPTGISIVDFLKREGMSAKYDDRVELAAFYGISDYRGSAAENALLMNSIQADIQNKPCK